jgi:hypothetical protein
VKERLVQQRWHLSNRADDRARPLADRHYNRQKVGAKQFVQPGSCLVLLTEGATALWITSWPKGEYVQHGWPGAWVNSCFRNEDRELHLSSDLIREAVAATMAFYGKPPKQGMISMVDPEETKHKRDPGRCYVRAGFKVVGRTQAGLVVLQLAPADMPMALGAMPMIKEGSAA